MKRDVYRNIEARSRNHCCRGEAMSVTQTECVCLDELKLRFSTRKSGYNT